MSESLLIEDANEAIDLPPSPEEVMTAFDEIVEGIDDAYDAMATEAKEAIATASSGEKRLWNSDSQNNFGSEPPMA
jgi:hypothetical protein